LTLDAAKNVYATGSAINSAGNRDFYSIKYDGAASTPVRIWEGKGLSADGSESGEAVAAAIDPVNGDLLVAGTTLTAPDNNDFALFRYKPNGDLVWKKILFRPDNDDYVIGMALDASGNAFVAGITSRGSGTASMTIQFDSDGTVLQSTIYNASPAQEDETTSIAVNSLNEAFVAGTTRTTSIDYLLYKIPVWPIQAPAPITLTPGYTTLDFSWPATSTAGGVSYRGKRADGPCSDSSAFGAEFAIPSNSFSASGLPQGISYCYSFKTTSAAGDSRWVSITAATSTPAAVTLTVTPADSTRIDLAWTSTTTGQSGFEVWRCADTTGTACSDFGASPFATTSGAATGYSDQSACPGTVYRYKVRAVGSGWSSAFSAVSGAITPSADNLIADPGIEAPDPFAAGQSVGWTYAGGAVASEITYDSGVKHGGVQSLNINAVTATPQGGIKQYVRFAPGGKYQFSAWFKTAAPAGKVVCDSLDGSNFLIANSGTFSDWEQVTQTLTIPSPLASSRLRCLVYTGYQANIDDLQIKPLYDLTATPYSESQINLSWIDSAHDETGYEIWRCKDPDGSTACTDFALFDRVAANITTYGSAGLEPNAKYRHQVRPYKTAPASCGGGWQGAFSNIAGPAQALYTKPVLNKSTPNSTQLNLSWVDTTSAESSFLLQRCSGVGCAFDAGYNLVENQLPPGLGKDTTQTWPDTSVCASAVYQYRLKPVNNGIQSASGCWNKSTSLNITDFKADFITRVKIPGNLAGYAGMKDDFSDIRIYDESARKELPYWIESKSDRNWAIVWFKTGSSNNIKLYYDNAAAPSAGNLAAVFGSGVMGFFPFGENAAFSGTTFDKSGQGNDLLLSYTAGNGLADPGASRLAPDSGNAISANGTNSKYAYKHVTVLPSGGTATIEAWIYPKAPQTNGLYNGIVSFGENLQAQRVYLSLQDNGRPAMQGFNNDFVPATGPQAVFNAWNHIAVVLNGTSSATLYMNGQPVSGTLSGNLTPALNGLKNLRVGSDYDNRAFNGFIDDVRIYNRALTATDIAMRYAQALPSVTVGAASGSSSCQTFSNGWGDDTFYSATLPVTMAAPVPPATLNAVANNETKVTLTWSNKTSDQTGFKIFRCAGSGCSFAATPDYTVPNSAAINTTVTYTDTTGLTPGTIYKYMVKAYKSGVSCPWDSAADTAPTQNTVTIPLPVPSALSKAYSFSSTCNDLRFTDSDGSTILSHWLESGCNTSATKAWLKFTSLPAGAKSIYLHYNNQAATAPATPDLTTFFDFYDDFSGTTLNASKWTKVETCGSHITQNNGLIVDGGCNPSPNWNTVGMYSVNNFSRPFVLEFSHYRFGGSAAMIGVKNTSASTNYTGLVYGIYPVYDVNGNRLIVYQDNVSSPDNLKPIASNAWQYYKIEVPATGANYYHGSAPVPSANHPSGYTKFYTSSSSSVTPLKLGMDVHNQAFTLGSVKLRKYANPEPGLTLLSEQTGSFLTGGAWKFQRQFSINNATGAALANYQMPIFVDTTPLAVDQIQIGWTNNTVSEEGYIIERCDNTANSGNCAATFNVDKTFTLTGNGIGSYIDREIKSNNAYCYRVKVTRTTAPAWTTPATTPICETARQQQAPALSAVGTTTQIKLDWTEADFVSESGAATAGSTTTLTQSGKSWGTNQWSGYYLKITGGAAGNIGASRKITGNTGTVITVDSAYPAAIANTHSYQIVPADGYGAMTSGIIGEYGYEIERCQDSGSGCTPEPMNPRVILGPNAARTYTDPLCSGVYNYRVHVVKYGPDGTLLTAAANAWPEYSNTVSAGITSAPAPTKVKAIRTSEAQLTLTWQDNTGDETGFNIYRCKDTGGAACSSFALLTSVPAATGTASGSPAGTGTTVTYNDTRNIAPDSTYRYQVKAVGIGAICPVWESLAGTPDPGYTSGEARATTTAAAPSDLIVQAGNTTQVNVSWNDTTASEGAIILERCSGAGCSDFSYQNNISGSTPPSRQYKVFYPFASNALDTSGNGLDLGRTPVLNTTVDPYFSDGLNLYRAWNDSFQSPVTGALNTDTHAIEFDFKIRQYTASRGKVFGYTVATATPDKSSPGIFVPATGSGYGLAWVYLDGSGTANEIHIGVNGIGDTSGAFTVNQWYRIRGEKSGNKFTIYVDGVLKNSTTVASSRQTGNFPLTFGRDATTTTPAQINLKNFSIDGNVQFANTSECAGTSYSYRTRAVRDGFASSRVNIANFLPDFATRVVIPASIVAGRNVSQVNDLRFYDYTAKTDIPYWLEGVASDGSAIVWIKPGPNNTITLYSNRNVTTAASASNGARVFDFFDDFTYSSASDPGFSSRWGISTGASATVSAGKLNVTTGSVYSQNPVAALATPLGKVFEMKNSWTTATTGGSGLTVCNAKDTYSGNNSPFYAHADVRLGSATGLQGVAGDGSVAGWNATPGVLVPGSGIPANSDVNIAGQDRIIGVEYQNSTNLNFYSKDPNTYQPQYLPAATTFPSVWNPAGPTAPYLFLGHIWGSNAGAAAIYPMSTDWVRVRSSSYPNPEPIGTIDSAVAFPATLSSWKASAPVLIAGFQPNYQTRLTVSKAALMNNDFSDLRFYDTTAQTELPYYIESKTDGVSATVWVKTGDANTIALYYGNPGAPSAAVSPSAMFDLFDDFTSLDTARWNKSDTAADISVDGSGSGTVRINSGALVSNSPIVSNPQNYAFEIKTYLIAPANVWYSGLVVANAQTLQSGNSGGNAIARLNFNTTNFLQAVGADGTTASNNLTAPNLDSSVDYAGASNARIIGVGFPGNNPIRFFSRDPDSYVDTVPQVALAGTWQSSTTNAYLYLGHIFGLGGTAIDTTDLVIDWVRARRYAYPEPQASVNTSQFPGNLNPGSGGSGSWAAGSILAINNFQPNFQTRMIVPYQNGMQADFRDIRFYDTTARVELPYWIESYTSGSTATVWLKTGANNTIALYHGNNLAASVSNGAGVFEFFDDFSTLDSSRWSTSDPAANITVDGSGKLRINTGALYSNAPLVSTPQNRVYEMKSQWTGALTNYSQLTVSDRQYFLAGNSGASAYAANRLQNTGSLYAQAADGTTAANNIASEAYPLAASPYTMAPLNSDSISGLEFQGNSGKISFFSKNPATYTDLARVTKPAVLSLRDTSKNRATNGWTFGGGYYVKITSGINSGLISGLASYTSNSIAVSTPFPNFFSIGDTYEVYANSYNTLQESGTVTGLWNFPSYLWLGSYLGSGTGTTGGGTADNTDLIVDWVRIRTYAGTMPDVTIIPASVNQAPAPDMYQFLNNWVSPYSATVTVATPFAANLAANPDFENGMEKWTIGAGAAEDLTTAASGLKSLKISKALAINSSELASLPLPQLLPGGSYTLSGNIKANLTNGYAFCRLAVNNSPNWDNPGVESPEFDLVSNPGMIIWAKNDNSLPASSDTTGTNGRLPTGSAAGTGDIGSAQYPSVVRDGGQYKMWYSGSDTNNAGTWRIYHATSPDGLTWTKHNNSKPDNSDSGGPSNSGQLPLGTATGTGASNPANIGDGSHIYAPSVVKDSTDPGGPTFKMWYSGNDGTTWRLFYAYSTDGGLTWIKKNNRIEMDASVPKTQNSGQTSSDGRIYQGGSGTGDSSGVYTANVIQDLYNDPSGQTFKMWYSGSDGTAWRLYYATSTDRGLTWTKRDNSIPAPSDSIISADPNSANGRIPLGTNGAIPRGDSLNINTPSVWQDAADSYKMWYSASGGPAGWTNWNIYYATSPDGLVWTKHNNNRNAFRMDVNSTGGRILLGNGDASSSPVRGDVNQAFSPSVLKVGSTYKMWYSGPASNGTRRIFYATQASNVDTTSNNDNQWHSFSLPVTIKATSDGSNLRILCGISRDDSGTDGLIDTANFDMIQLVPNNQAAFNLTAAKISESQINLSWSDMATDETGYKIWRCKDPDQFTACTDFGVTPLATLAAGATFFQDSQNLQPNGTYRYKVFAYKDAPGSCGGGWESSYSNINFAKTEDATPVSLDARAVSTNRIDLSWTDKSSSESGFSIERSTDGINFAPLPSTAPNATLAPVSATSFSDTTACPSSTYTYRIRALNRGLSMDGGRDSNCAVPGDGWNKRKHLNITGFQPQYPLSLYVTYASGMKADFSDLRFFDSTAGKELPHWIESIAGSPATARVWLKSGDNNSIDMYYGNTSAAHAANPANVFEFWDDFSGDLIDKTKWTVTDTTGLSVSNGYLHGTSSSGQIRSIATFGTGKALEYKAKATRWPDNPWYIGGFSAPSRYLGWLPYYKYAADATFPNEDGRGFAYIASNGYLYKIGSGVVYNTADFPSKSAVMSADNMLYRVTAKDAANAGLHIDDLDRLDAQFKPLLLVDVASTPFTYADAPIVIGGSLATPGEALQVDWDWVRIRKSAASEPVVTLDFEVSSSSLTPSQTCFSFANQWGDEVAGTRYYSNNSNPVTTATLFAPSNLTVNKVTPTRIDLAWLDNTGNEETGFEIQDCGAGCADTSAAPVAVPANTTRHSFTSLTAGTNHCYRVRAVKGDACGWPSDYSAPACVTLSDTIHLDATAQGPFAVKLDWNNQPNDSRGFEIEKKLINGGFAHIATVGNVLTYTDKVGIGPLKSYTYRVRKSDKTSQTIFSDSFSGGFNTQLWTADAGQSWRVADPLAIMSNNAMLSDTSNGTAKLTATPGKLEFYSKSKGNAGTIYEAISLNDLGPTQGDFDLQLDYAITKPINSSTQNTNNYVILRYDTFAPAGYQYKITLYRTRIKDSDNLMKDAYVAQYTEVVPNTTFKYIFPTSDLSGKLRIARTTGSDGKATVSLYTSSGGAWDLRNEIPLKSARTVPSWLSVQQQLSANELANTDMTVEISNITLSAPANSNPYSNEAQVVTKDANGNVIANTTPAFVSGDGDCTCTVVGGVTVCTPGKAP